MLHLAPNTTSIILSSKTTEIFGLVEIHLYFHLNKQSGDYRNITTKTWKEEILFDFVINLNSMLYS